MNNTRQAQKLSESGSLSLYLLNNETDNGSISIPDYGFDLNNSAAGSLTLYNTTTYTAAENLLYNQENTGGTSGLLNSTGTINIAPLP